MDGSHDGKLLAAIASSGSSEPFEALVQRHGPMVFNVCRRLLHNQHDAEDAAQAVFLVLWKKAGSLAGRPSVAGWLHRVARNVCRNAKRADAIRKRRENEAMEHKQQPRDEGIPWTEIKEVLDEELDRLPEKYKLPFVLFHLEGRSLEEIAALLGTNSSTVGTRVWRAREKLRSRFERRGIAIGSTPMLVAALDAEAAAATLPAAFASTTLQAAPAFGAGALAGSSALSTNVAALATGGLSVLGMSKIKLAAGIALLIAGAGAAVLSVIALFSPLTAVVEGRVMDAVVGGPARGTIVKAQSVSDSKLKFGGETKTDNNGRYRLRLVPNTYNIWADTPDMTAIALDSYVVSKGTNQPPDLKMTQGGFITGRVVGPDGQPLSERDAAFLQIGLHGPARPRSGGAVNSTRAERDGTYRIRAAPGENYPYIMGQGFDRDSRNAFESPPVVVREGETTTLDFHAK